MLLSPTRAVTACVNTDRTVFRDGQVGELMHIRLVRTTELSTLRCIFFLASYRYVCMCADDRNLIMLVP